MLKEFLNVDYHYDLHPDYPILSEDGGDKGSDGDGGTDGDQGGADGNKGGQDGNQGGDQGGDGADGAGDSAGKQTVEVIEFEGVDYNLNENGDAVDENGEVKLTKAQIEELESGDGGDGTDGDGTDGSFTIDDVQEISGVKLTKDGQPLTFDSTPEGFAQRDLAILEKGRNEGNASAVTEFFTNNPLMYDAYKHYATTGSLQGYGQTKSYSSVDLSKLSIDGKVKIIKDDLTGNGLDAGVADGLIKNLIDAGKIDEQSTVSLKNLKTKETNDAKARNDAYVKTLQDKENLRVSYNSKLTGIVETGKIKDINLPETFIREVDGNKINTTRGEFLKFMTEPVHVNKQSGDKYTAFDIARHNANKTKTAEDDVFEALSLYLGSPELSSRLMKATAHKKVIKRKVKKVIKGSGTPAGGGRKFKLKLD